MSDLLYRYKILIVGDASVGKTSLTLRYISGFFLEDLKLTIGVDFYSKTLEYDNNKVKLQIWDFGGEERFRFLLSQYCRGANGALYLFDITNPSSLDHLSDWIKIIRKYSGDIPVVLIGSKLDLRDIRQVKEDDGALAAKKYDLASFIELSSKTGENVEKAFNKITELLMENYFSENP